MLCTHRHWLLSSDADCETESRSVVSNSLRPHGLYSPWNSPGQNTGVDSLSLLQGIFPTQGLNPGLLHCMQILYQQSYKGSPGILEWVAYPFSRGSSWPRNRTEVSCIAGRFFTGWTTREADCMCCLLQCPLGERSKSTEREKRKRVLLQKKNWVKGDLT